MTRALQLGIANRGIPDAELLESFVQFSKKAINHGYETMGLRHALLQALKIDTYIESTSGPER